jgi:hypothetical protein
MNAPLKSRSGSIRYLQPHDPEQVAGHEVEDEEPHMKTLQAFAIATLAAAGVAAAIPAAASADCYRRSENGTSGAIIGAIAGAALGNAASGRHDRGAGTAVGAVAGAAIGSSIARNNTDCYYDGYGQRDGYYRESYARPYDGYGYSRVYVEPRPYVRERVYVEPRPYVRERVYVEPRYGHYHHHGW